MHNTTLMRLFTKPYIRWEKSAQLPIKPQQPKQPRENKQKNIEKTKKNKKNKKKQKKTKKTKKPRVSGKGLGGHFSQIPSFFFFFVFFWFSRVFFFFCVFFGLLEFFFDFSNDFSEVFSEVLPFGLFITDFAQTAPFPQNFARAAPQHVCNIFSKANSFFISLLLGKSLLE